MVVFILVPVRPSPSSVLRPSVSVFVTEKSWEDESGFFHQ